MERLTEIDPGWLGEECWTKACHVGDDMIDAVYERLWEYENIGSTPGDIVQTLWNAAPVIRCRDCVYFKFGDYCTHPIIEHAMCREDDFCSHASRKEIPHND